MQKDVNLVDLIKGFPTNILLQNLVSIQKRTSPLKFAHLAEKSDKGSISNLSTKRETALGYDGACPRRLSLDRRGRLGGVDGIQITHRLIRQNVRTPSAQIAKMCETIGTWLIIVVERHSLFDVAKCKAP